MIGLSPVGMVSPHYGHPENKVSLGLAIEGARQQNPCSATTCAYGYRDALGYLKLKIVAGIPSAITPEMPFSESHTNPRRPSFF